jgi:6-phospho-3-hexuloisomerase
LNNAKGFIFSLKYRIMAVSLNNEKFDIRKFADPIKKYHMEWSEQCYNEILKQSSVLERASELILPRKNLFLAADGRSRDMLYCAGKRFVGIGYHVYGIGEDFTISMRNNKTDVFLGVTGTGTSKPVLSGADVAKEFNIPFVLVTSYETSPAALLANEKIIITGRTKETIGEDYEKRQLMGEQTEIAGALGSQFEFKALETLECLASFIGHKKGKTEKDLKDMHPNV